MSRQHRVGRFVVQLRAHVCEVVIIFKVLCVNVLFVGTSYMWCLPKIDHYKSMILGQAQLHQSLVNTEILMKKITRFVSCNGVTYQLYIIYINKSYSLRISCLTTSHMCKLRLHLPGVNESIHLMIVHFTALLWRDRTSFKSSLINISHKIVSTAKLSCHLNMIQTPLTTSVLQIT